MIFEIGQKEPVLDDLRILPIDKRTFEMELLLRKQSLDFVSNEFVRPPSIK